MANFTHFATFPIFSYWSKLIENGQFYTFCNFSRYLATEEVQNNSEWPILAILQLFQYFPTEVVQIDSEWPILDILQIFQYFPTEVV